MQITDTLLMNLKRFNVTEIKRPDNEEERLIALRELMVLDSAPEPLFDELTMLASKICETPIALISLVDKDRQWFKSKVGIGDATQTPREHAFCAHAILKNELLIVGDVLEDDRFKDSPLVTGEPHIRFYAGMPITMSNGHSLGTLCVIDRKPRQLDSMQKEALTSLSKAITKALLFRSLAIQESEERANKLSAIIESSEDAIITKTLDSIVTSWNDSAEKMFGYTATEMIGKPITRLFPMIRLPEEQAFINRIKENKHVESFETERITKSGKTIHITVSLSPIRNAHGKIVAVAKIARNITETVKLKDKLNDENLRMTVALASINDAIITTNQYAEIDYLNPMAEAISGYRKPQVIDKYFSKVFEMIDAKTRQPVSDIAEKCIRENKEITLNSDTLLINHQNKSLAIECLATPIIGTNQRPIGAVVTIHLINK